MNVKTDKEIINGILKNDNKILNLIYRKYYPKIKILVMTFRNIKLNVDDIFQEGLTRAVMNIKAGKFKGNSTFLTYFSGICRNICLKELSTFKYPYSKVEDIPEEKDETNYEMIQFVIKLKESLDPKCIEIINFRFGIDDNKGLIADKNTSKNMRFEDIAKKLNIKADNARQRYKRCIEKLQKNISKYPELSEQFN